MRVLDEAVRVRRPRQLLGTRGGRRGACQTAVALRPRSSAAWCHLGIAFAHQKKLDEAVACYHKAIELNPRSAVYRRNLGIDLFEQKALEQHPESRNQGRCQQEP